MSIMYIYLTGEETLLHLYKSFINKNHKIYLQISNFYDFDNECHSDTSLTLKVIWYNMDRNSIRLEVWKRSDGREDILIENLYCKYMKVTLSST